MVKRMLVDARHPEETRVAVVSGNRIEELDFESAERRQLKGNIYLAKVTRVEPSLQAAFVDYGGNRHGFLAFSEIHPDYYQIPKEDRDALLREEAEHAAEEEALRRKAEEHGDEDDHGDDHDDAHDDDDHGDDRPPRRASSTGGGHEESAADALRQRRMALRRRYKIQDVIRRRQVLLVQVVKEERGNKGAALTTYLSLAGRYCVLMPNTTHGGGISRKISNQSDRKRLKQIMAELQLPPSMGCIVRTAGLERTRAEIKRDFDYLTRLWDEIRDNTLKSEAPALIYEDSNLVKRAIRDIYSREIDDVLVEGEDGYRAAKAFMKLLMPSHAKKVQAYADPVPLFQRFGVESQLSAMYQPVVQLPSGGYLVINPTEALVSIDINSGRSTREHNIEETALKTNLEAAQEIARQLRLRDMAGLVVIDFIDMESNGNVRKVERAMKEALKNDRARIQVGRISSFGLLEMSRQRLRTGVLEASTHSCPLCDGTGLVRTVQSAALSALRGLEEEAVRGRASELTLRCGAEIAIYVLNRKRDDIVALESRYGVGIEVLPDDEMKSPQYAIETAGPPPVRTAEMMAPLPQPVFEEDDDDIVEEIDEAEAEEQVREVAGDQGERKRRRRRRRGGRRDEHDDAREPAEAAVAEGEEGEADSSEAADSHEPHAGEGSSRRRRRRGRRGGRRNREEGTGQHDDAGVHAEPADAAAMVAAAESGIAVEAGTAEPAADEGPAGERAKPARRRPRARKSPEAAVASTGEDAHAPASAEAAEEAAEAPAAKPKRPSRRRKADVEAEAPATPDADPAAETPVADEQPAERAKRAPRRRKAAAPEPVPVESAAVEAAPAAPAPVPAPAPASSAPEAIEPANDPAGINDEPAEGDGRPTRRGWWQRTFGQ